MFSHVIPTLPNALCSYLPLQPPGEGLDGVPLFPNMPASSFLLRALHLVNRSVGIDISLRKLPVGMAESSSLKTLTQKFWLSMRLNLEMGPEGVTKVK